MSHALAGLGCRHTREPACAHPEHLARQTLPRQHRDLLHHQPLGCDRVGKIRSSPRIPSVYDLIGRKLPALF
jgi:hypothetical protein